MALYIFLCKHLPIHPDVNKIIFDLYYNTYPRPNGCHVYHSKNHYFIYGDVLCDDGKHFFYTNNPNYPPDLRFAPIYFYKYLLFKVIYNNVPINYWKSLYHGVHFHYTKEIQTEAINNITYGLINNLYVIYTTFIYNHITYKIIFNYNGFDDYKTYTLKLKKLYKEPFCVAFGGKLEMGTYTFYIPPDIFNDNYTLIMNSRREFVQRGD